MLTAKKPNPIAKSILGILLAAALLTATYPITAYAAENNPVGTFLDVFPASGVSSDTMDVNEGTINTLYGGGTIKDNKGTISSSRGTVNENHGSIKSLSAGHVGTNYGIIERIENSGSLGENDPTGTVRFVGMGNEITRNDGTIQENAGTVSENFGTVVENSGAVIMHDGKIVNNKNGGTVTFEAKVSGGETIPAKGTIIENTGKIEISNATVTVEKNSGSITLGANATLKCDENTSGGVITKTDESANITCTNDNGRIHDETAAWYEIVFAGDDGQAKITECDKEENGVYYTQAGSGVIFTLPPEYICEAAVKLESGNVNTWGLNANPEEGSTEFTIVCHKCSGGEYKKTEDKHWQICAGCGKTLTDTEGPHTFGEYVSDDNSTCVKDGTETSSCSKCGYSRTRTVTDSHLTSDHHEHIVIDQRAEPTETSTGLTQGMHCDDCHKVLTAQETIPKKQHTCVSSSDYLYDGSTHWKICAVCGEVLVAQKVEHTFSGNSCTVCGYTKPGSGGSSSGRSAPATYSVVPSECEHGSVTVSPKTASAGVTVTVTVSPDQGYTLETVTATDKNDKEVALTATELGKTYTFKMPSGTVKIEATFKEDNTMLNYFVDVTAEDYYYDAVLWAAGKSITGGVDAVRFNPDAVCTCAQAVTFLWRAAGCPEVETGDTFADVAKGSYYEKAVAWAVAEGITSGTSEAAFSPDAECTRAQIVTFLWRTAGSPAVLNMTASGPANPFRDIDAADYCYDAVLWAAGQGITEGTAAATFSPNNTCTRDQIVTFLYRYMA